MSTSTSKKITPETRVAQFPDDLQVLGNAVTCIYCNHSVEWQKKSTVTEHMESTKHIQCKMNSKLKKTQTTLETAVAKLDTKQQMIFDFVEMMLTANIPLEKKDKMEEWLKKYVPGSGCIPKANTLRKLYLPQVLQKNKNEIKEKLNGQKLSLLIDTSPDRLSRNVLNTIVSCGDSGERYLIDTRFLDSVTNITLFDAIDDIRSQYGISWNRLDALVCDSASYNKKLYSTIKKGINPEMTLMRCWTHLLDLVSDTWQDSPLNSNLHALIAKFQHIMNRSSPRKARYLQHLKSRNYPSPRFMPQMVLTRWNSWYGVIEYLDEFLPPIKEFVNLEHKNQEKSELIEALYDILNDSHKYNELRLLSRFYCEKAKIFHDMIEEFEKPKGITYKAYNLITNLWNHLRFNIYLDNYDEGNIQNILDANIMDYQYWISEFKNLHRKAFEKLDMLIKEHESWEFLKAVRVFNPEQLKQLSKNPDDYAGKIPHLDLKNKPLKNQFAAYLNSDFEMVESDDLIQFWRRLENTCPQLSKVAIRSLNIPVTSVDVERSFSMYRDILSHKRTSLKLASINTLSMINYNSNINNDESDE